MLFLASKLPAGSLEVSVVTASQVSFSLCLILSLAFPSFPLLSSLLLREYRISGDLEIHSGILIGTTEMEAKGLCADQTKATWKAVGSQQRRVMTRSSFTAARHKRGYSPKLSFKDSSVCHLDLVGVVLSISVGAGPPLLQG